MRIPIILIILAVSLFHCFAGQSHTAVSAKDDSATAQELDQSLLQPEAERLLLKKKIKTAPAPKGTKPPSNAKKMKKNACISGSSACPKEARVGSSNLFVLNPISPLAEISALSPSLPPILNSQSIANADYPLPLSPAFVFSFKPHETGNYQFDTCGGGGDTFFLLTTSKDLTSAGVAGQIYAVDDGEDIAQPFAPAGTCDYQFRSAVLLLTKDTEYFLVVAAPGYNLSANLNIVMV